MFILEESDLPVHVIFDSIWTACRIFMFDIYFYAYMTFRKLAGFKDLLYIASVLAIFIFLFYFSPLSRNIYMIVAAVKSHNEKLGFWVFL